MDIKGLGTGCACCDDVESYRCRHFDREEEACLG